MTNLVVVEEIPNPLQLAVKNSGLELESAQSVLSAFQPLLQQAEEWRQRVATIHVTDVSQTREMKLARESRLALRDIRLNAEKARKKLKDESLRRGKAIDGVYNVIEYIVAPLEKSLLEQEQFAANKEIERKAALKAARVEALLPYVRSPADLAGFLFEDMTDLTFANLLANTKAQHEERIAAAAAAEAALKAAEAARIAEEARLRAENDRLKAEAAAREEEARKERLRLQALAEVERQKAQAERDRLAEIQLKEHEAQRARDAASHAEFMKEKQARLAAVEALRVKFEAEEEAKRAAEREAKRIAAAPDREKLKEFANKLRGFKCPALATNSVAQNNVDVALDEVTAYIDEVASNL